MKKYQQHGGVDSFTFVYTSDRVDACDVRMYTSKSSEVCTLRFGNSFTLPVVTPQDLLMLAQEIETFAKRAHDFHYPELLEELEGCGTVVSGVTDAQINEARAKHLREEEELSESDDFYSALIDQNEPAPSKTPTPDPPSKVELLMQGTVSAPQADPMNDPMNW